MDIYKISQEMTTNIHYVNANGATILYKRKNKDSVLKLTHAELHAELIAIGIKDENDPIDESPRPLSQWEALNIVIRFESARDMDKEIDNSDIGKAINKLLK